MALRAQLSPFTPSHKPMTFPWHLPHHANRKPTLQHSSSGRTEAIATHEHCTKATISTIQKTNDNTGAAGPYLDRRTVYSFGCRVEQTVSSLYVIDHRWH